jgi:hypothetical protein
MCGVQTTLSIDSPTDRCHDRREPAEQQTGLRECLFLHEAALDFPDASSR